MPVPITPTLVTPLAVTLPPNEPLVPVTAVLVESPVPVESYILVMLAPIEPLAPVTIAPVEPPIVPTYPPLDADAPSYSPLPLHPS